MSEYFKSCVEQLNKIRELMVRKEELQEQIDKLKNLLAATAELMDESEQTAFVEAFRQLDSSRQGLTQAVRSVLTQAGREHSTPVQIRDQLVRSGYKFDGYQSNPLISVHSVLNRMKDELEIVILEEGTKGYRFRRSANRNRTMR
jgi:hypothetical protein